MGILGDIEVICSLRRLINENVLISGVSRSSMFIAFDVLFQQLTNERAVTVGRTCATLRRARQNAIPTARHFALLFDLLFEVGIAGYSILDLDIRSTLASVSCVE